MATRIINSTEIGNRYNQAKARLIVLDYDGTLISRKHLRIPPDLIVLDLLRELAMDDRNSIVVASSREKSILDNDLKGVPITIAAEQGAIYRNPNGDWTRTFDHSINWIEKALSALKALTFHYWGSEIERKEFSLLWRYDKVRDGIPESDKRQIMSALRSLPIANEFILLDGGSFMELKTPGINRGAFISRWVGSRNFDFIMAVGDGRSDEELFNVLGEVGITIRVSESQESAAHYHLRKQQEVIPFLNSILSNHSVGDLLPSDNGLTTNE